MSAQFGKETAENIVDLVGGAQNVVSVTHCMTRLRFTLRDESLADDNAIKAVGGVSGVVRSGGLYQVVVGVGAADACQLVEEALAAAGADLAGGETEAAPVKKDAAYYGNLVLGYISASVTPALPVLVGAGMILSVLAILSLVGLMDSSSSTYTVLYQIGNAGLYYLPIFVGYNAAKKLKMEPFAGAFLGGILLIPTIMEVEGLSLFGFELSTNSYSASVFPILISVPVLKLVDMAVDRFIPDVLKLTLRTTLDILITAPLMLLVLAPFGSWVSSIIANAVTALYSSVPFLAVGIIAALWPLLVATGMHTATFPITLTLIATIGYDPIFLPSNIAANFSVQGTSVGCAFKCKDKSVKPAVFTAALTSCLAAMEPALFGVLIPLKKPMVVACSVAGIMGCVVGALGVVGTTYVPVGITALPTFASELFPMSFIFACICAAVSFAAGFIAVQVVGFDESVLAEQSTVAEK